MTLYVVHGNTYYDGYGHIENLFGIYTEKDQAEAAKDTVIKGFYNKEIARGEYTLIDDISEIEVCNLEVEANSIVDIMLGVYCEWLSEK